MRDVMLAGAFKNFGDYWATALVDWTAKLLIAALTGILILQAIRRMSIKAAIGGAIGLVLCLAIFSGRYSIEQMFNSEFKNPGQQSNTTPTDFQGAPRMPAVFQGRL
ncbi:hypothetical protein [Streptomyces sp. NRRL B-24484]|uniref:hypothetical protein n=1 Tax=Streptomyces sp. NRRL B-24484 TaxID=1463833 RepID=UPI0004BE835C|nr:hypothetical protein [Streptomyces sp. NRRL B-24484]